MVCILNSLKDMCDDDDDDNHHHHIYELESQKHIIMYRDTGFILNASSEIICVWCSCFYAQEIQPNIQHQWQTRN